MEFRCTSVVRPTGLQQVLWGNRLQSHVASRIIAKPLLDALTNSAALVVVRKPEFMELRDSIKYPVVQVLRNTELNLASPHTIDSDDGVMQSDDDRFEPVVLRVHRRFTGDFAEARAILSEAHRSYDILEPFNRIMLALELVQKEEVNQRKK
jgi:hypothetical protein